MATTEDTNRTRKSPGELVRRAVKGDRAAWDALVDRYSKVVWAAARAYRLNDADAGEVYSETWKLLVENLDGIREPDRIGAWLVTTARREALRLCRHNQRVTPTEDAALERGSEPDVVLEAVLRSERQQLLQQARSELSTEWARLIGLLTTEPPTPYETISETLGMPIGSIGPTRGRCLAHMARRMRAAGYADSA
jgi:RNA polymerase sigma factor (sigma-70 family)